MEEKKTIKISLSTFFLILAIIAIIVMGFFIYKLNNDKTIEMEKSNELQLKINNLTQTINNLQKNIDNISKVSNESDTSTKDNGENNKSNELNNINLKTGTYTADEEKYDDVGISYKECGVTLAQNNLCSIYQGFGTSNLGTYSIVDNKLICNTLIERGENGGIIYREYNIIFEFEIINSEKIKLTKIINNSNNKFSSLGLVENMTYSFSASSNIKVLLD